jgi:hypothetical protein
VSSEKRRPIEVHAAVPGPSNLPAIGSPHDGLLAGGAVPAAVLSQKHLHKAFTPLFFSDDENSELQ